MVYMFIQLCTDDFVNNVQWCTTCLYKRLIYVVLEPVWFAFVIKHITEKTRLCLYFVVIFVLPWEQCVCCHEISVFVAVGTVCMVYVWDKWFQPAMCKLHGVSVSLAVG